MLNAETSSQVLETSVVDFLADERRKALSKREWQFRMRGYGYGIRDHGDRQIVTKLPQGVTLGILPSSFA
ncbi:MAG: hypothetical protein WAO69_01905 [Aestuariivita sp.]|uniref:hypothetical protein n=1 Tax=Aestuariivita sp. TaxID=1872407 RepID=UPI003BB153C9